MEELNQLWYVGVIIVFFGSLGGAMGDTMVRRAYVKAGESAKARNMLRTPLFLVGILLTIVLDPLTTFLGLLFAPSSIVTPFAGVHIFWAVLIAHFWLKEPMNIWQIGGAVGVVAGVILIVVFSSKDGNIGGIDDFDSYARSPETIVYVVISAVLLIIILLAACALYPCSCGHWEYQIQRLGTALASGFLGGNTNVALKFFSIIVIQIFNGHFSVFGNWRIYVITLCILILAISQLVFLNISLRRYEAVYVVPTINSCLVTSGTIGSIVVLHEIPTNWPAFCIGLVVCVLGILVLTLAQRQQPSEEQGEKAALPALQVMGGAEEQQKPEEREVASQRKPSLQALTRSLSLPAVAVADMAVILNSKALYSMYTMKEKQRRQTLSGVGLPGMPHIPAFSTMTYGDGRGGTMSLIEGATARPSSETRRPSMESLTGWLSRLRGQLAIGGGGNVGGADGSAADPAVRSTVSEPVMHAEAVFSSSIGHATGGLSPPPSEFQFVPTPNNNNHHDASASVLPSHQSEDTITTSGTPLGPSRACTASSAAMPTIAPRLTSPTATLAAAFPIDAPLNAPSSFSSSIRGDISPSTASFAAMSCAATTGTATALSRSCEAAGASASSAAAASASSAAAASASSSPAAAGAAGAAPDTEKPFAAVAAAAGAGGAGAEGVGGEGEAGGGGGGAPHRPSSSSSSNHSPSGSRDRAEEPQPPAKADGS